jgi:hypothetical protein
MAPTSPRDISRQLSLNNTIKTTQMTIYTQIINLTLTDDAGGLGSGVGLGSTCTDN